MISLFFFILAKIEAILQISISLSLVNSPKSKFSPKLPKQEKPPLLSNFIDSQNKQFAAST